MDMTVETVDAAAEGSRPRVVRKARLSRPASDVPKEESWLRRIDKSKLVAKLHRLGLNGLRYCLDLCVHKPVIVRMSLLARRFDAKTRPIIHLLRLLCPKSQSEDALPDYGRP